MNIRDVLYKIKWSDKIVDLFVVILGITIAFAMDNCSESRRTYKARNANMKTLLIDLRKDSINLNKASEGIKVERQLIDTLFALTDTRNVELSKEIASKFSLIGALKGVFVPENVAYESLRQSGSFSLMGDSVTIKLNRLQDDYQRLEKDQEIMRDIIFEYGVPIFFNYDSRTKGIENPSLYFTPRFNNVLLALSGNIGQRQRTISKAVEKLSDTKDYISKNIE